MDKEIIKMDGYTVTEIAKGIYLADEFGLTTMFIVEGEKKALVIDCGVGVKDFLNSVVKKLTDLPIELAVTHAHIDHVGGRGQFQRMHITKADAALLESNYYRQRRQYLAMRYVMRSSKIKPADAEIEDYGREPELVYIKEGHVIDLGGRTAEVIELPGHSSGGVGFLLMPDNILFTGDVVNRLNLLNLVGATNVDTAISTFERVLNDFSHTTLWASHYHKPFSLEDVCKGLEIMKEVSKKRNSSIPRTVTLKKDGFTLVYHADRIH